MGRWRLGVRIVRCRLQRGRCRGAGGSVRDVARGRIVRFGLLFEGLKQVPTSPLILSFLEVERKWTYLKLSPSIRTRKFESAGLSFEFLDNASQDRQEMKTGKLLFANLAVIMCKQDEILILNIAGKSSSIGIRKKRSNIQNKICILNGIRYSRK